MVEKNKYAISRKDAIKRLGSLTLSLPFAPSVISRLSSNAPGTESAPAILKRRQPAIKGKPNILWITTEGVPVNALSCYGSYLTRTPNIDRLAKEGLLFRNSFCNNALCAPSRATLLTGKYNHLNGMLSNYYTASNGQPASTFEAHQQNFARILKNNGYNTAIAGKWHLPANPGEVGFDRYIYKKGAGGPYYKAGGYFQNEEFGSTKTVEREHPGYGTDNFTNITIEWMKDLQQRNKPFLMTLQFFNDHRPFDPPHKYEHIYDHQRFPEPGTFWDNYETRSSAARIAHMSIEDMKDFNPPSDLSPRQRKQWNYQAFMRHFFGTLKSQDDNMGRILDFLDQSGLSDNTIVVYTGDHGFYLGDHGWFDKRFMYEQALRVPWMIRYPGVTKPGSETDAWVLSIDNAPTVLDMAGISIPADMQGRSLMPVFQGKTPSDWRKSMYYHYYEFQAPHWVLPHYGIRTERFKLISYYTINEWEMFDLQKDPDEMDNLMIEAGYKVREGYEDVLQKLLKELEDLRKQYKDDTGLPVNFRPVRAYN
ncbi:sulfatase [Compostibacter hankyongensis]